MKESIEAESIYDLHFEAFGVEPVITGINYADSGTLTARLIAAIQTGIPYVEQELPKGVDS